MWESFCLLSAVEASLWEASTGTTTKIIVGS